MKITLLVVVAVVAGAAGFLLYQHSHTTAAGDATVDSMQSASKPIAAPVSRPLAATLPEFSLSNRAGEKQSIRSWPGKSMIVNFWATWCGPCRKEIPLLKEIAKDEASAGFQVVGIAIDFRDDVLKYADDIKIDYPILIGEQEGLAAADAFGVDSAGLPFTAFTDEKGRIVTIFMGELNRAKIDAILSDVKRVNRGELTPEAARATIASRLASLKSAV
jgi:thiol-disulfide isomerase/thioredoxin